MMWHTWNITLKYSELNVVSELFLFCEDFQYGMYEIQHIAVCHCILIASNGVRSGIDVIVKHLGIEY
jgi:hypothetical protein